MGEKFKEITQKISGDGWKTNSLRKEPNVIQSEGWKTNSLLKASENQVVLPEGWASAVNKEGHKYYYHKETEEVSWHPPVIEEVTLPHIILPQGWASRKNEEGHVYYYHKETEEVSWYPPKTTKDEEKISIREEPKQLQSEGWKTNSLLKASENQVVLPEGWASAINEKGHKYYYHKE